MSDLHDIEAIRTLNHRYCASVDGGDTDALLGVFTDDAVLDHSQMGIPVMTGFDGLREGYRAVFRRLADSAVVHMVSNHVVAFDDADHATGSCYFRGTVRAADGTTNASLGRYEDTYRRTAAGWRIATRVTVPIIRPITGG